MRLVDMPGYGFAEAPKDMVRRWRFLVNDYLRGRAVLKRALVLIDSRHGLKDVDREVMDMLDDAAVSYHLVLTKGDKVKPIGARRALRNDRGRGRASIPPRIPPSSPRRAKPVAGSPSCERQSSKRQRPRETTLLKLIIGNRAYSSWSMRGWLACKQSGEEFEEHVVPMFDAEWEKRREGDEFAPSLGKVPILWDGECVVWDSLAIIEFLADRVGRDAYWPEDEGARADGPLDGGGNALGLRQPAPRAADERAQELPAARAQRRGQRRDRPDPAAVGAGARALRRHRRFPVRRLVRGGHDVRAGRHPLHHLWRAGAHISPACT